MTFELQLDSRDVYQFIRKFEKKYKQVPGVGFMAGHFKVTTHTIHRKINELVERSQIKIIVKRKNFIGYEITGDSADKLRHSAENDGSQPTHLAEAPTSPQ